MNIVSRPWKPQDLLDDLQMYIDEEPDNYLNGRRTAMCMARDYLKEHFEQKPKWISVEERLPEYGKYVLVADERNRFIGLFSLEKTEENYVFWRDMGSWTMDVIAITHWMPLPTPPEV